MTNSFPKDGLFLALFCAFLLLPLAQVKILFWGIPLYLPEIAIGIASGFFLYRTLWHFPSIKTLMLPEKWVMIGGGLFFLGAVLAFVANPFSLTGLGMIKSWFFFPLLGALLVFFEAQERTKRNWFIVAWVLGLLATAIGALIFVLLGVLTYDSRLSGLYSSPNFLASFLAPAVLFLITLFRESKRNWWTLIVSGAGLVLIVSVLYGTRSYGVWLAIFVSIAFYLLMQQASLFTKKNGFIAVLLLVIAGFFLLDARSDKWQDLISFEERSSLASRLMIWQSAEEIREDHWFLGIGVGRFQDMYLEYQRFFPPYLEWAVPEPHSLYLAILLSTGIIGFLGFCLLVGRIFYLGWRSLFRTPEKQQHHVVFMVLSVLVFYLVYGLVDTPYFKNDLALSFWFLLALGLSVFSRSEKRNDQTLT